MTFADDLKARSSCVKDLNYIETKDIRIILVRVEVFEPQGYEEALKIKLWHLKQSDSYMKYLRDFQYLSNEINDLSEADKLFAFQIL